MANRQPPKALNKSAADIAANAKAEKERKAASKKALRDAMKQANVTEEQAIAAAKLVESKMTPTEVVEVERHADNLAAAAIEAEATGMSFEQACESMGIDPQTGAPVAAEKQRYSGPMLALVATRKSYVKAANGIQCNGDELATSLGHLKREQVIQVCMKLLGLESNPYSHLNPGQQSMNLRNKLRHATKTTGSVTMAQVRAEVQRCLTK